MEKIGKHQTIFGQTDIKKNIKLMEFLIGGAQLGSKYSLNQKKN